MVLIDAVSRLLPGVLSSQESALEESIYSGLLEYPQYTRPREFEGREVPEVLLSGNHRNIELWRLEESLKLTAAVRPDLFDNYVKERCSLPKDEKKVMEKILGML
jgi:tRNA (guanine37-N1)-methyltransferase